MKKLNKIKEMLAQQGKTGKWLANEVGVTCVTVSRWATNQRQPPVETLYRVAKALELEVCEILVKVDTL